MDREKPSTRHLRLDHLGSIKARFVGHHRSVGDPAWNQDVNSHPVPSRSFAMIAQSASSAALDGPYVGEPAFSIVPRLVVTLTIRPQPWRIMSGTTAFASAKGAVVCTATKRCH